MWTIYVLRSQKSNKFYVGMTQNLDRRLKEHNTGRSTFTSSHMPWILIYHELATSTYSARKREQYLKSAAGKRFINNYLDRAGSLPD